MKKMFGLALLVVGLIALGGCGEKEADSGKVNLDVWAMGDEAIRLKEIEADFETKNPGIDLVIQAVPWGDVRTKVTTAITGKQTPDVAQMGTSFMVEFDELGAFRDLTKDMKDSSLKVEDFLESTMETNELNGKLVGLPWYTDTRVIFYNKELLEKAGLSDFPATWKGMKEYSGKLKEMGVPYSVTLPVTEPNTPVELYSFIWQNGAEVLTDSGEVKVSTPEFKEAFAYYTDFFIDGEAPIELSGDVVEVFDNGQLGFFMSGPWMLSILKDQGTTIGDKWGVATLPQKETKTSFVGGSNFVIFEETEHPKEAMAFLEYMLAPETQVKWYTINNNLPTTKKAWESEVLTKDERVVVFSEQLKDSKSTKNIKEITKINRALSDEMEKVIYGKSTVEESVATLEAEINKILK